jgi:hypothetical protein
VARDRERRTAVPAVGLLERVVVPARDGEHEPGIAAIAHVLRVVHLVHSVLSLRDPPLDHEQFPSSASTRASERRRVAPPLR